MAMRKFTITGVLLALLFCTGQSDGAPITYEFSGQIDSVLDSNGVLDGIVSVGSPFQGAYTIDAGTPDSWPDEPKAGRYVSLNSVMTASVGSLDLVAGGQYNELVVQNSLFASTDSFAGCIAFSQH